MRIISGFAKGRKLVTPPSEERSIRPTSDRAREALFSIIGNSVEGAQVLDLYSGTGALGLEAFSRGALFVLLVDKSPLAIRIIKDNCLRCLNGYSGNSEIRVLQHDLRFPVPAKKLPVEASLGFDLIFADPPYAKHFSQTTLDFINNSSLLKPNGILIVEERSDVSMPLKLSSLNCIEQRHYGDTVFYFYQPISR